MSRTATRVAPGQMDMLAVLEDAKRDRPARCMYRSPARGVAARVAEFAAWQEEYGHFGSLIRSHAWHVSLTCPSGPTDRCQPTVLAADVRRPYEGADVSRWPDCDCTTAINEYMHRGACRGCNWEGPPRGGENPAAEDALDHAWAGWRDLPTVPRVPEWHGTGNKKQQMARARWLDHVNGLYPAGWLEAGGPIRTIRTPPGTRHVPDATPFDGYDISVVERAA